jgi:hypothetical protein
MAFELLKEMEEILLKEEEEKKKEAAPKVAKTLAQKVYHRDYIRTKKKKYRVDQE